VTTLSEDEIALMRHGWRWWSDQMTKIGFRTSDEVPARMIGHIGRFRTDAGWMTACHKVWIAAAYSPAYEVHWLTRAHADQIMDAEAKADFEGSEGA